VTLLLLLACVLDRTGQSATAAYERELALQTTRAQAMEQEAATLQARVDQLEEINRYRGRQEAEKQQNLDQIRSDVARLRGAVEESEHNEALAAEDREALDADMQFRLEYLELRVSELEDTLGLETPDPPSDVPDTEIQNNGEVVLTDQGPPQEVELPTGPEELLAGAETHLTEGRPKVARVLLQKLLDDHGTHERVPEARYRLAETYFNEANYQRAILAFEEVVSLHPDSKWAPWAMIRQGECFELLGQRAEAELFWADVIDRYPKSKAAGDAKALLGR
jgi:TolA-binding protein